MVLQLFPEICERGVVNPTFLSQFTVCAVIARFVEETGEMLGINVVSNCALTVPLVGRGHFIHVDFVAILALQL